MKFDTGIQKIDALLNEATEEPLKEEATDNDDLKAAHGVVHDLINRFDPKLTALQPLLPKLPRGKKWKPAPLPSRDSYCVYNSKTTALVQAFQQLYRLEPTGTVDHRTLWSLKCARQSKALITPAHFIFEFGVRYSDTLKIVVLTGGKECGFDYTVMNRNTDRAGLSLGVLHWAQKPGRLYEAMLFLRNHADFGFGNVIDSIFGGKAEMDRVMAHLKRGKDGLDVSGYSKDRTLEFARPPLVVKKYWPACFEILLSMPFVHSRMSELAMKTFRKLYDETYPEYPPECNVANLTGRNLKGYAPKLKSQRAVAFALDMINQHGQHVPDYYKEFTTANPNATEREILVGLRDRARQFWLDQTSKPEATRKKNADADSTRRNYFINTPNLSARDFDPS